MSLLFGAEMIPDVRRPAVDNKDPIMFVGHYGISFAAKQGEASLPLWVLFIADRPRHHGLESARPLLYALYAQSGGGTSVVRWGVRGVPTPRPRGSKAALSVGAAVFSHWVLDFIVHRPDLPLYDNTAKVGLGLWNLPALALGLEAVLLFGGMWLYFRAGAARRGAVVVFGLIMLAIQAYIFFGPPPVSDRAAAATALGAYAVFAVIIRLLERRPVATAGVNQGSSPT